MPISCTGAIVHQGFRGKSVATAAPLQSPRQLHQKMPRLLKILLLLHTSAINRTRQLRNTLLYY